MTDSEARTVGVAPERLARWLDGFADRHGHVSYAAAEGGVEARATDGTVASIRPPFGPLPSGDLPASLVAHVNQARTVGALLVRRGGVAVGVFTGRKLIAAKVDTRYVQGRTKAGGWSQQRYARRRDAQAREVYAAAADLTVRIVLPHLDGLDAVATGGDKAAVAAVLADPRLTALGALVLPRVHPVPDPRLAVLQSFPERFLAVDIGLRPGGHDG